MKDALEPGAAPAVALPVNKPESFENVNRKLPPAGRGYGWCQVTLPRYPADPRIVNSNGLALLLPFLDQPAMDAQLKKSEAFSNARAPINSTYWPEGFYPTGPLVGDAVTNGNGAMASTQLAVFRCPSDPGDPVIAAGSIFGPGGNLTGAKTNYDFIARFWEFYRCNSWRSDGAQRYMFGQNSDCPIAQVSDGMSNTLMLGETTLEVYNGSCPAWSYRAFAVTGIDPGHAWASQGINDWGWTYREAVDYTPKVGRVTSWGYAASLHTGGAQFAMGDGSVHFIRESIPKTTLEQMANISDNATPNLE